MEFTEKNDLLKLTLLGLVFILWCYWLWNRKEFYILAMRFPGLLGLPFFGVLHRIRSLDNIISEFGKLLKDCGKFTILTWIGTYPVILTADPAFIKDVLCSNDLLEKAQPLYQPLYNAFKGGLIASPADEWHKNRRMLNPSFHQKVLTTFLPIFNKAKDGAIQKFGEMISNKEVLLSEELQRITLSITVETTMGKKMQEGDQVSEELVKAYVICIEKLPMECFLSYVKLGKWYAQFSKTAKEYVYRFIEELLYQKLSQTVSRKSCTYTMECSENSETNVQDSFGGNAFNERAPNIFVDQAINLYREGKMSHHSLIGESNTIVSAAFETSANGLLSSLLMLAIHPVVQERLYDEIVSVFPEKTFFMDYEHMQHLPYLDMVVNETLRLLPPIPIIGRQVVKNTTLSNGLVLPRGLEILISIFDLHRRTDIWGANAHEFNPDNFLPGNLEEKHTHAYIPFSKGIRNCIGWKYALMAIKILLAGLIRNFSFSTSVKLEELKFTNSLSLKYTNEPAFTITHRLK